MNSLMLMEGFLITAVSSVLAFWIHLLTVVIGISVINRYGVPVSS